MGSRYRLTDNLGNPKPYGMWVRQAKTLTYLATVIELPLNAPWPQDPLLNKVMDAEAMGANAEDAQHKALNFFKQQKPGVWIIAPFDEPAD